MRKCPKCGALENTLEMTTSVEPAEANTARCLCGWTGTVGELISDTKPAPTRVPDLAPPAAPSGRRASGTDQAPAAPAAPAAEGTDQAPGK